MLKIVQFEVYVLEDGRWTFHARYPGYEWDQALEDARRTEIRTGIPTKIIRDTYDRDKGTSEESVAYLSPNAKIAASKARNVQRQTLQKASGGRSGSGSRSNGKNGQTLTPVSDATFFVRLILSLGASVVIAGALTILLSAVFNALPKLGYQMTSALGSQILTYWYVAMLALSAIALNKAYVPWRRMLAGRNAPASQPESQLQNRSRSQAMPPPLTLKPKNETTEQKLERERAVQDMKMLRGDLDSLPPPGPGETNLDAMAAPPPEPPVVDLPATNPEPLPEEIKDTKSTRKAKNKDNDTARRDEDQKTDNSDKRLGQDAKEVSTKTPLTDMDMDRLVMVRFLGDVVMSVRAEQDNMDATTRFGISLYLSGAASTLADQRGLTPDKEREILSDALELVGHGQAMRDSFFAKYDENLNAKKNQRLIQAGEQDMLRHLRSSDGPAKDLGGLLEQWTRPNLTPEPTLGGAFLLTYTDIPQSSLANAADLAMNRHNHAVRQVVADCNGQEVRHTGKGIFAHFDHPDDAICAAISIQQIYEHQRKLSDPLPPARVALVASLNPGVDSDISGELFHAADTLCRRLANRQIACDALLRNACTISDVTFGRDIPHAHSGIANGPHASEILWQPLPATP